MLSGAGRFASAALTATLAAVELPVLPSVPRCPAAQTIAGVVPAEQGVICRVMQRDHETDRGLDMTAGQSGFIQHEASGGVFLSLKSDPQTVVKFCHGDAIPVLDEEDVPGGRASFSYCPVWQAERERIRAGRERLLEEPEPEPVASGVTVDPFEDPYQALRDLQEFGRAA